MHGLLSRTPLLDGAGYERSARTSPSTSPSIRKARSFSEFILTEYFRLDTILKNDYYPGDQIFDKIFKSEKYVNIKSLSEMNECIGGQSR
jgi:hypothetical protein